MKKAVLAGMKMKKAVLAGMLCWALSVGSLQGGGVPAPREPERASAARALGDSGLRQSELDAAASAFARSWRQEDVAALAGRMSAGGIRLHLGGQDYPILGVRQARAALEDFVGSRSTRGLSVARVVDLGGSPRKAFAELRWEAVVDRTSEPLVHTIFVSYERDDEGWRIIEIRVL